MITKLTSSAAFTKSGATLAGEYQPGSGITAVVGENGAGKTYLSIETARWLLYGKKALRGAAADYADARASGTFMIRDAAYEISRGREEWIKDASGKKIAVGAEKVTEKVTELMGYDLEVFDLVNAATQGNVQKLGRLRPAERKAIIDKVLRLTSAEAAEKHCRAEALGLRREADAMTKLLRAPGEKPTGSHRSVSELFVALADARALRKRLTELQGQIRHVTRPAFPPTGLVDDKALADLEAYVADQRVVAIRHIELAPYARAPQWTLEQLDAAAARLRVRETIDRRGPKPTMTRDEIETGYEEHRRAAAHRASDEVTCPKCDYKFRPTGEAPPEPRHPRVKLDVEEKRHRAWPDDGPALPDGEDLTAIQIAKARDAHRLHGEWQRLDPVGPERSAELSQMRAARAALDAHTIEMRNYEAAIETNKVVEAAIDALGPVPSQDEVDALADELRAAQQFEDAVHAWEVADQQFRDLSAKIADTSALADEYKLGAEDVAHARATVKALIAPSISRIATELIRDMSMNKLPGLTVDENMDVLVGQQRIETLSGAGATIANLALRIAMGRALVGRVFPVFLGDEIDGDMSPSRREATLQAMVGLKKHMSQIILVTHRDVGVADAVWKV